MKKKIQQKLILRLFLIFMVVNCAALACGNWLDAGHISHFVLIGANSLLFLLAVVSLFMNIKALGSSNPNVFVRSVMGGTFIKLMVILAALAVYMVVAGKNRSIGAVLAGMGLYIVYTIAEVRGTLQLNNFKN